MFAGVVIRDSRADPRDFASAETLLGALTPYGQADVSGAWKGEGALLVQALTWNTPESRHEAVPEICPSTGRVIVSWARLDNRTELCGQLGLEPAETLTDPQIILAAHRAWGEACAARLEGDFSFLIHHPERQTAFCARDALGVRPFFYHASREVLIFGSTAAIFPVLRNFDASRSQEWLARFLIGESSDPSRTAFSQVRKLPPAHRLTVQRDGPVEPVRYFEFTDTAPRAWQREEGRVSDYRDAFHRAVDNRLRSDWRIGAENSGGLDSATIIGRAAGTLRDRGADLHGFSVCHMADEPHYILDLAMHAGLTHNSILTRPTYQPAQADMERAIRVLGYPPEHNHALFHVPFFEQCQGSGIRTLLSGFGGDEMVTSPAHFVHRQLFLEGRYLQLFAELPGNMIRRAARLATMGAGMWRAQRHPQPRDRTPRLARTILRREVVEAYGLTGFNQANGDAWRQARTVNEHLLARPNFRSFMVARLEGCSLVGASYGIDYRWPMLDRQLIARFLETPAIEKRHRHWGRYLHRRACAGTVPDKILWKQGKALGGIPYLERDRRMWPVNLSDLPAEVGELVDPDAVINQRQMVQRAVSERGLWLAYTSERNNLRALSTLDNWLKSARA